MGGSKASSCAEASGSQPQSCARLPAPGGAGGSPPTPRPCEGRDEGVWQGRKPVGRVDDVVHGLPDVASLPHSGTHCPGCDSQGRTPSPTAGTGGGAWPGPPIPLCLPAMGSHEKDSSSPKRALSRSNSTVSSKHSSVQQVGGLRAWGGGCVLSGILVVHAGWPGGTMRPRGASPHFRKGDTEMTHPLGVPGWGQGGEHPGTPGAEGPQC